MRCFGLSSRNLPNGSSRGTTLGTPCPCGSQKQWWSIGRLLGGQHATVDSFRNESAKRMKRRKPGAMDHLAKQIGRLGNKATNWIDKLVTWLIHDEPTH